MEAEAAKRKEGIKKLLMFQNFHEKLSATGMKFQNWNSYNYWETFMIIEITGAIYKLRLTILVLNFKYKEGASDVNA